MNTDSAADPAHGLPTRDQPSAQPQPTRGFDADRHPQPAGIAGVDSFGTIIAGRYKLLEQIGEGGMGTVWVAEQTEPVRRTVALKLIKAGMDSKTVLSRFEAERQALALMDHPNIAKVLDGGTTESGRPFFVMEYAKGIPFTRYCDNARLTIAARLRLFVPVCQAIQHAHQKGIIHRDLKPSNILVCLYDGQPVPKVIDFGLAKAMHQPLTEHTLHTAHGVMMGTPLYMSPEQAEVNNLDVDTRTDIYSLGVILYELLTGTTPFERQRFKEAAWQELVRLIKEEEPPRPSDRLSSTQSLPSVAAQRGMEPVKLTKLVRGELDWIIMKCLEKDRSRRYDTANGLAREIERYLADEVVEARPPSAGYRLKKLLRRHKGPVLAAALVLLALVAGIIGVSLALIEAKRQEGRAIVAKLAEEEQRRRTTLALDQVTAEQAKTGLALAAETSAWKQTREALNTLTDEVISTLFAKQQQLGENEKAFLRKVLSFYQSFAESKGDTEEARFVAADGQFRVAKVRAFLGETAEAAAGQREAIQLLEKLAADFPSVPFYRQELAWSHEELGNLLRMLGNRPDAERAYRQALAIEEKLAADFPGNASYRWALATSRDQLALLLRELGQWPEAETTHRQALAIYQQLVAEFPTAPEYRQDLAVCHNNLALLLNELRRRPEAESVYRESLAIAEQLAAEFPGVPRHRRGLAGTYDNLGLVLRELGKEAEAEAAHRKAIAIYQQLVAEFPTVPSYRQDLAASHTNQGVLFFYAGKGPEAEAAYQQALPIQEKLVADFPMVPAYRTDLAGSCVNFGHLLRAARRPEDALQWYAKAISLLEADLARNERLPKERLFLRNLHFGRANALADLKRYPEAIAAWDRSIELAEGAAKQAFRLERAITRAQAGDHSRAVSEADTLTRDEKTPGNMLYLAARVYALSITAAKDDAPLKEQYAQRALALLRRAYAAGYFKDAGKVEHLQKDHDLAALQERAEFKALIAELKNQTKPDPS